MDRLGVFTNCRLLGQCLGDPLESHLSPLPQAHDPGKGDGRPHQHSQVSHKSNQLSEGHLSCNDLLAANGDGTDHTEPASQAGKGIVDAFEPDHTHLRGQVLLPFVAEGRHHRMP